MTGDELDQYSPMHFVRPDAPATIVFHGTADVVVPLEVGPAFP